MLTLSLAITLFLVFDPFGNLPIFAVELDCVEPRRKLVVIIREMLIALGVLLLFLFAGEYILKLLSVSQSSLGIAGGIIMLLIAIKMVFPGSDDGDGNGGEKSEPLLVPLAVPLIAGPASIATIILMRGKYPDQFEMCLFALLIAWGAATAILLFTYPLSKFLGHRVLTAGKRLMGMLLTAVAVEMFVGGVKSAFLI